MFRRLLMTLLIACLALPAAAMPLVHGPAPAPQLQPQHHATMMAGHEHHAPARHSEPQHQAAQHDCIGCIAPLAGLAAPALQHLQPAELPRPALADRLGATRTGPETPPPRP